MRGGNVEREFSLSVILQLVPVGQNLLFSLEYIILFATKVSTLYSQTSTNAHLSGMATFLADSPYINEALSG